VKRREDEDFWGAKDRDCWGGDDRVFPNPLGEFSPTTRLTWDLMGVLCEGIDATLEVTPWKIKGRMKLLNLECSIN
jgi:hypothetical protein